MLHNYDLLFFNHILKIFVGSVKVRSLIRYFFELLFLLSSFRVENLFYFLYLRIFLLNDEFILLLLVLCFLVELVIFIFLLLKVKHLFLEHVNIVETEIMRIETRRLQSLQLIDGVHTVFNNHLSICHVLD